MNTSDNILEYLELWSETQPLHTAIIDGYRKISYRELWEKTRIAAAAFSEIGIKEGDFVITFLPNCYELIMTFLALNLIGAVFTPCSPNCHELEMTDRFILTPPQAVIVSEEEQVKFLEKHQHNCEVILLDLPKCSFRNFEEFMKLGEGKPVPEIKRDLWKDPNLMVFTSGSTGAAKGVVLPAISTYRSAINIKDTLGAAERDIFAMPLPLCHMFGIVVGMLTPIFAGGTILTFRKFNAAASLDAIQRERATIVYGVPTMFIRGMAEQEKQYRDLSSVRIGMVAGALSGPGLMRQTRKVLGFDLIVGYGMTEMVTISVSKPTDSLNLRMNSVGSPYPGVEVKIIDGDGYMLSAGQTGEIISRGYGMMLEYYNNTAETAAVIDSEGWIHTGDLGYLDENGYLYICGRKKDLILRGGQNIFPAEIEKLYHEHFSVSEICVVGVPHSDLGEQTVACLSLENGKTEDTASLREYAKDKIIKYKIPDRVLFFNSLPKLPNGKIDKQNLKKHALAMLAE